MFWINAFFQYCYTGMKMKSIYPELETLSIKSFKYMISFKLSIPNLVLTVTGNEEFLVISLTHLATMSG